MRTVTRTSAVTSQARFTTPATIMQQQNTLHVVDLAIIVVYLIGLFLVGLFFSRRQTSEDTYYLGNRKTPWFLAGVSVLATLLSTLTYLSIPGEMIRYGIGYFSSLVAFVLIIPTVNWVIVPVLMRLPVTSVYEYLERRFGLAARMVGAAVFVLMRFVWMGLIIYTASNAVREMTGWNITWIILLVGIGTTLYTTAGGMQAVLWSDFAQFVLLLGGAVVIPTYIAFQTQAGPADWWEIFSTAKRTTVPVFTTDLTVRITIVGMILEVYVCDPATPGADPLAPQGAFPTWSGRAARRSVWVFALCNIVLMLLLMTCGLALFYYRFTQAGVPIEQFQSAIGPTADHVLPQFIAGQLPRGVSGLLLAALLAAAMSSLSSGINSVGAVVVTDFVGRLRITPPGQSNLALAKWLAVAAGVAGIAFALLVVWMTAWVDWNLVEMIGRVNHLFVAPLGALFFAGILFRRVGTTAALLGFCCGVLTSFLVSFSQPLFGMEKGISFMWIMPASLLVSLAVSYAAGFVFRPPSEEQVTAMQLRSLTDP